MRKKIITDLLEYPNFSLAPREAHISEANVFKTLPLESCMGTLLLWFASSETLDDKKGD